MEEETFEAVQFNLTTESLRELKQFFPEMPDTTAIDIENFQRVLVDGQRFKLNNEFDVYLGDWIIQFKNGAIAVCPEDVFVRMFEPVPNH